MSAFSFPEVDHIIGISSGGVHPARLIGDILNLPFGYIYINYRLSDNTPQYDIPKFLDVDKIPDGVCRILLVDDASVSGLTLKTAKEHLSTYKIITFVLKGKADLVLYPEIANCVNWPWQ